jgi:hypothetical protein
MSVTFCEKCGHNVRLPHIDCKGEIKMKYLRVVIGSKVYDIPLEVIAENRARYYANFDNPGKNECTWDWKKTYKYEYGLVMADPDVAKGWASNNMDWSDVVNMAVEVLETLDDPHILWVNAEKIIVEK